MLDFVGENVYRLYTIDGNRFDPLKGYINGLKLKNKEIGDNDAFMITLVYTLHLDTLRQG